MKTLETLYQEVLASDELKKGLAEAAKTPEGLKAWICAQGCEATLEQVQAFLKEKQERRWRRLQYRGGYRVCSYAWPLLCSLVHRVSGG